MAGLRRSFAYSFAEKYTLLLLGMAGTMVIARVLTPAEIGLYSIAAVLVSLVQVLRDFGVGQYLIQEAELTTAKLRAALAVSLGVAWTLAALVLLLSLPVARFYHDQRLAGLLQLLALNFALVPFSALTLPLLRRQLRFAAIFAINGANAVTNLAVSVSLALLGCSYLSLAWATLAGSVATLLMSMLFRPAMLPWLPSRHGAGALLRFGAYATGGVLVDELGVAAPGLVIGRLIGVEAVALFSRALGLLGVFNQAVTSAVSPVVFPLFAQRLRDGIPLRRVYLETTAYLTALSWPFFLFVACMALPLVNLLYGPQWNGAVPLIRVMCFSSTMYSMFSMARYLFVASGAVKTQAKLDLLTVPLRIGLLLLSAPFGLYWVAWAVVGGAVLRCGLTCRYLARHGAISVPDLLLALRQTVPLTAMTGLAPGAVLLWLPAATGTGAIVWQLALAGAGALLGWLVGLRLCHHPMADELLSWWRKRPVVI